MGCYWHGFTTKNHHARLLICAWVIIIRCQPQWHTKCKGYAGGTTTIRTATYYGLKLQGQLDPWKHIGRAKAKRKNLTKRTNNMSQKREEKLFIDSGWSTTPIYGGIRHWDLVMDDNTGFLWSYFLQKKSDTSEVMINLITNLKKLKVEMSGGTYQVQQ